MVCADFLWPIVCCCCCWASTIRFAVAATVFSILNRKHQNESFYSVHCSTDSVRFCVYTLECALLAYVTPFPPRPFLSTRFDRTQDDDIATVR